MKNILYIALLLVCVSCNSKEQNKKITTAVFTETIDNTALAVQNSDCKDLEISKQNEISISKGIMTHYIIDNLRLRDDNNLSASIITTLPQNTAIRILETGNVETIDGITAPWIKVISETGFIGWCFYGYVRQLNSFQQDIINFPVTLVLEKPNFARQRDSNIISNVNIIRVPESNSIRNIHEIDNIKINTVFDRPILNREILLYSHNRQIYHFNIFELLNPFQIILSKEDIEKLSNLPLYGFDIYKVNMEKISLFFYKNSGSQDEFLLFVIEYENNSTLFDFNVRIETERNMIHDRFGEPTFFSEDNNVYIYFSFTTNRQMNITFENDKVVKVQLITFEGI